MIGVLGMQWWMGDGHVDSTGVTRVGDEMDWDRDDVERGGTRGGIWERDRYQWNGEWNIGGGSESDKGGATCQPRIGHNKDMGILGLRKVIWNFPAFGPDVCLWMTCSTSKKTMVSSWPTLYFFYGCISWGPDMGNDHWSNVHQYWLPIFACVLPHCDKRSHRTSNLGYKPICGFLLIFFDYFAKGPTS